MKRVILFILVSLAWSCASAQTTTEADLRSDSHLYFAPPLARTDGSALAPIDIKSYRIKCGENSTDWTPGELNASGDYSLPLKPMLPGPGEYRCTVVAIDQADMRSRESDSVTVIWHEAPTAIDQLGCRPTCEIDDAGPVLFADEFAESEPSPLDGRTASSGQHWEAGPYFVAADGAVRYTRKYSGSAHIAGFDLPDAYTVQTALAVAGLDKTVGSKPASYMALLLGFDDDDNHISVLFTGQVMRLYERVKGSTRLLTETAMPDLVDGEVSAPIVIAVEPGRITVTAGSYLLADEAIGPSAGTGFGLKGYNESRGPGYGLDFIEISGQ